MERCRLSSTRTKPGRTAGWYYEKLISSAYLSVNTVITIRGKKYTHDLGGQVDIVERLSLPMGAFASSIRFICGAYTSIKNIKYHAAS